MPLTKKQKQNQGDIVETIYTQGPISRIDIAHKTGITPATVSSMTSRLIEIDLIEEVGEDELAVGSGRKKILLDIKANHSYFMGLELSEKFISFCLTDNKAQVIQEKILPIAFSDREQVLTTENVIKELHAFIEEVKAYEITAIGVAVPGHYHPEDKLFLTLSPLWKKFDLNALKRSVDLPFYLENNVKCMLLHKKYFGEHTNDENYIFFHVSRGIFCAYLYKDELYSQSNNLVGEIGHSIVQIDGELCECGNRGCLQTIASETWLIKKAQVIYDHIETSYLHQLVDDRSQITLETLLVAYKLGDPLIINLLETAIQSIATVLVNLSMTVDAERTYVHGRLLNEPLLAESLHALMAKRKPLFEVEKSNTLHIVPYKEINGALGAASLGISKTFTEW